MATMIVCESCEGEGTVEIDAFDARGERTGEDWPCDMCGGSGVVCSECNEWVCTCAPEASI